MTPPRAVVAGSIAQRPGRGGHTWAILQYVLGLQHLGWDVCFVDRLEPEMCRDRYGEPCRLERSTNVPYWLEVMRGFDLVQRSALLCDRGSMAVGAPRARVLEWARTCDLLLNVMGFLEDEAVLEAAPLRVFLDIDPGFGQMWRALGQADLFAGHDAHVTLGANIGAPDCPIPTCGLSWIPWRPPVVLDAWPVVPPPGTGAFTSVAAWRGPFAPVEFEGATYGLRVHEFRRFTPLPRLVNERFEVALDLDAADVADRARLEAEGWTLLDPAAVASDPWSYRDFIAASRAEFLVAKNAYVRSRSGWLSDRSACYLASGRPVLAQDTGIRAAFGAGGGLLAYSTLDEAQAGVEEIVGDYARHSRAARAVAEEVFDSDLVFGELLSRLGLAA